MKGAITEDSPIIINNPSRTNTMIIGYSQYFFCLLTNLNS